MAKKKNNGKGTAKPMKPEDYIRTRARQLPIYKCYKSHNPIDEREMCIVVVRQHPQGTFSSGTYLIDKWCLGVKNTSWRFNISEEELKENMSVFEEKLDDFVEIDYVEAHNWVYGAVAFAGEAGIMPCGGFELTQYLLDKDDENTEIIEYEFGRDGKHCLMTRTILEASKYIPILDRNLGIGNYTVEIGWFDSRYGESVKRYPFKITPRMEYTYEGGNYPVEIELNCPEIYEVVIMELQDISDDEIGWVLSLEPDKLREDLQNIILYELGWQWDRPSDELETGEWNIIRNSIVFLTAVAKVEDTLPVILEIFRQPFSFYDYNMGDFPNYILDPLLFILLKDNPRLLKPYLLEAGPEQQFKVYALGFIANLAVMVPDKKDEIVGMALEILEEYRKDLPKRTICDGTVTAFAISILVKANAEEHLPLIEKLYATGMVDEGIEGHIDEVRLEIRHGNDRKEVPPTDPYSIRDEYRKLLKKLSELNSFQFPKMGPDTISDLMDSIGKN